VILINLELKGIGRVTEIIGIQLNMDAWVIHNELYVFISHLKEKIFNDH